MSSKSGIVIEIERDGRVYKGTYLVKNEKIIVRFGNARTVAPAGIEPEKVARSLFNELVNRAIAGK